MTALQVAPRPQTAWRRNGIWPAFRIGQSEIGSHYFDDAWAESLPMVSIAHTASVFAAWGERGRWALWAQPRWEVLALWTEDGSLKNDVSRSQISWMQLDEVVDELFAPDGYFPKPSARQRERFRASFGPSAR